MRDIKQRAVDDRWELVRVAQWKVEWSALNLV